VVADAQVPTTGELVAEVDVLSEVVDEASAPRLHEAFANGSTAASLIVVRRFSPPVLNRVSGSVSTVFIGRCS
jgi:hypothetical protein